MNTYAFAQAILKIISLKKIFIWTLTALVLTITITIYEHRDKLFSAPTKVILNEEREPFSVSTDSEKKLVSLIRENKTFLGVSVLSANLRKNTRTRVFYYVDAFSDKPFADELKESFAGPKILPLFSSNEKNNFHMVKLLNGEFTCAPADSSLIANLPGGNPENFKNITICRASLPPYSGNFTGWIALFVNGTVTNENYYSVKLQAESLAEVIYTNDIAKIDVFK